MLTGGRGGGRGLHPRHREGSGCALAALIQGPVTFLLYLSPFWLGERRGGGGLRTRIYDKKVVDKEEKDAIEFSCLFLKREQRIWNREIQGDKI